MAEDRFFLVRLSSFSCSEERLLGVLSGCLCLRYFFGVLFPFGLEKMNAEHTQKINKKQKNELVWTSNDKISLT